MKLKRIALYLSYPIIIIISFALEEAVKDLEWFKNLVNMFKILIENIGEIGLSMATIMFVILWVKWSLSEKNKDNDRKDKDNNKKFNLIAKYIYHKNKNNEEVEINRFRFYDKYNEQFLIFLKKAFKNLGYEITSFNKKTGEYNLNVSIPEIDVIFGRDERIKNPNESDLFKEIECEFLKEFKINKK